jgi:hypothetical protein
VTRPSVPSIAPPAEPAEVGIGHTGLQRAAPADASAGSRSHQFARERTTGACARRSRSPSRSPFMPTA